MAKTSMNIRMDADVKKQAQQLFSELGMDMTTAVNIFLKQAIRTRSIPFAITTDIPNSDTVSAFREGEKLLNDPNAKTYKSVAELFKELDS